jgi:alpha-methylacyl-CoA racemase
MAGPLTGFRVIEMAGIGPGPFCAMLLADMGAEVIRIQARAATLLSPILNTKYDVLARGRRSMAIDLKKPGACEAILKLVAKADALIEGFRPGVMERLGLGPQVCQGRNPRIVYGRVTGWGQTGPLAQTAGHDITYLARTGVLQAIGAADGRPAVPLNVVADMGGGGLLLAFGIVCAILEAKQSGAGQVIDSAMVDGAALLASSVYGLKAAGMWTNDRDSNLLDGGAHFYGTYECADGRYIAIGALEPQFYSLLLEKIGLDPADFQPQMNPEHWPRLKARLAAHFKNRVRADWMALLEETDACVAPVLNWDEAMADPHNQARNSFIQVDGITQPAPAPRFSRTQSQVSRGPARLDEHTHEILSDWGLPESEIAVLTSAGAI